MRTWDIVGICGYSYATAKTELDAWMSFLAVERPGHIHGPFFLSLVRSAKNMGFRAKENIHGK